MPVNLTKGANVSLTKADPGLQKIRVGLGWDLRVSDGADFDLDSSCFLLKADDKVRGDDDFIFYNNATSRCGSVVHKGDNRTGAGDGDDEMIEVDLSKVPAEITKLMVAVTIHDAATRKQNFGMVRAAYIRVLDATKNVELARYDLTEDASVDASMMFGELYRREAEWKFRAVGQGFTGGLGPMAQSFGVNA